MSLVALGVVFHLRAGADVQVVLVNVQDLDVRLLHFPRPRVAGVAQALEVDGHLVVTVVKLRRSDERIEPALVDVIDDFFVDDLHVVVMLLVQVRNVADPARLFHGADDVIVAGRIHAVYRRIVANRRHDRNFRIVLLELFLDFVAGLLRDRDWQPEWKCQVAVVQDVDGTSSRCGRYHPCHQEAGAELAETHRVPSLN